MIPLQAKADQRDDGGVDGRKTELGLAALAGDQIVDHLARVRDDGDDHDAEDHQRAEQRVEVLQREPAVRVVDVGRLR